METQATVSNPAPDAYTIALNWRDTPRRTQFRVVDPRQKISTDWLAIDRTTGSKVLEAKVAGTRRFELAATVDCVAVGGSQCEERSDGTFSLAIVPAAAP